MKGIGEEINLDFERSVRIGMDEAIFSEGKSPSQLEVIVDVAAKRGHSLLLTRLSLDKYDSLTPRVRGILDYCPTSRTAIFGRSRPVREILAKVAVVAAGSSDAGVAREVQRTLYFNGVRSQLIMDVGVAGLWRLTERLDELRTMSIVIAVAGMDAALPTVLGGLLGGVIIAVPTSVGYGVAAGGGTALNAILASCSPGITTVNIDNGYGAACAALRILQMEHIVSTPKPASLATDALETATT